MKGFGIHTSLWAHDWTEQAARLAIPEAAKHGLAFVEIALIEPDRAETEVTRALLEQHGLTACCSLGLPEDARPTTNPDKALEFVTRALEKTAAIGASLFTGVTYGSIGERTGQAPTWAELDAVARFLDKAAAVARGFGIIFGIEVVNRYESHLFNTTEQAVALIERVGAPNIVLHLDTYHMNIEATGQANAIRAAGAHLAYIHLSESHRGVPGTGTIAWDEVFAGLAGLGFTGGMALESFIHMPPRLASALSVWRPVASSRAAIVEEGLPFLRNKARQYGLI
ncbi:sugar phosphate isomerase/epimerase [Acidiphilium sp. PA]|uniref:sugar phosphate isomerase/epimerase family protein n=1 Tax=Acidiphilium sp. PA TaxID=2871705 RepID=UPI002243C0D9|nr:sugar phosphate isomerase/epimerase family protein [Acidiphilium sp. PA]MCW8305886.1 sugar phosphate isomerase/epimerase [Acidiphilium sp. PA]